MNGMTVKFEKVSVVVPAGKYFLGDPCYAVPQEEWMGLLNTCNCFDSPVGRLSDGTEVLAFSTQYGDGTYRGTDGREYDVDAGLIGLTPLEAARKDNLESLLRLGSIVEFSSPTRCSRDEHGEFLSFGNIVINTGDSVGCDEVDLEEDELDG